MELALSNIPGFNITSPPTKGTPAIQHWPALVSKKHINQKVTLEGQEVDVPFSAQGSDASDTIPVTHGAFELPQGELKRVPLGRLFATRSGDKGGNANLGVWGKTEQEFAFLQQELTVEKLKELLSDLAPFQIDRYELPNFATVTHRQAKHIE